MNDVVWSVNILIGIGLIGVCFFIYYILTLDKNEEEVLSSNLNNNEIDDQ